MRISNSVATNNNCIMLISLILESKECPTTDATPPTREWILTNVADKKNIGTAQRIGEKVLKIAEQTEKSGARIVAAIGGEERGVVRELEERVLISEKRVKEAESRMRQAEVTMRQAEVRVKEEEEKTQKSTERLRISDVRVGEAERRVTESEEKVRMADERVKDADEKVKDADERAMESERRANQRVIDAEKRVMELEVRLLAAEERVREAGKRVREAEERVVMADTRCKEAETREDMATTRLGEADKKVVIAEERLWEGERRVLEAEERVVSAEKRAREADDMATDANRRVREAETLAETQRKEMEEEERRLRLECDRRIQEAEEQAREVRVECDARVQVAEERIMEEERRVEEVTAQWERRLEEEIEHHEAEKRSDSLKRQWVIQRNEIHMTEEILGGGGWGEVKVAHFRGIKVAAKSLYQAIRSRYYAQSFVREMNIASRIRHPNLVQFIGATMEDGMIILMELMPTSLRSELEQDNIKSPNQLVSISLDVARALNYLHLMQPDPIIHRDISSANILLEPLPGDRWRAKVTDYGSVNFQQELKTVGPGAMVYASPEAHVPALQSPKMDIFSFGVLLVEMCTAQFPQVEVRENLIVSITDQRWVDLIRRCILQNKGARPSAAAIIDELLIRLRT